MARVVKLWIKAASVSPMARCSLKIIHPRPHNLKHSLHNIRFFNPSFLFRCVARQDALHKERAAPVFAHERSPDHKSPSRERRLMAALDVTQKAGVYETLSSLNLAFAGIIQHLQTLQ